MYYFEKTRALNLLPAAAAAITVTLGLFVCMYLLIAMDEVEIVSKPPTRIANIIMPEKEISVIDSPEQVEPLPDPDPTPDIPEFDIEPITGGGLPIAVKPVPTVPGPIVTGGAASDGGVIPLVKVSPIYPERARSRGIEGFVDLAFAVTETGIVTEVVVTQSQPEGVFDKSAIKAAKKWRYRPRIVEGTPVRSENVETRLTFKLDVGR